MKIPFAKPNIGQEEIDAVVEVLKSGNLACGKKTEEFEQKFAEYVGAKYAVAFNGCTASLWSALAVNQIESGDTVALPAITYTATASVVVEHGAIPMFFDVDREKMLFPFREKKWVPGKLPGFKMSQYEADEGWRDCNYLLAVNLTGQSVCDRIPTLRQDFVVIDSAHRIEKDDLKNRPPREIWCYSFYATKNMTTGYGGMACTNDECYYKKLKLIQNDGRIKSKPTYTVEMAVGGRDMNDIAAAIGLEQLKKLPAMTIRRNEIVSLYNKNLGMDHTGNHLYPILVSNRERFISLMADAGIQCSIHFKPLHLEPAYNKYWDGKPLPNAEYLGERLVSLPLFPQMTDEEVNYVADKAIETGLILNE